MITWCLATLFGDFAVLRQILMSTTLPFYIRLIQLCLLVMPLAAGAQNTIGLPAIKNYPREVTHAGSQSWCVAEDGFGTLYFANNAGLLCYNGNSWKQFQLPDKTFLRSLAIAADNKIYAGGQDALGYFSPAENGLLQYHSLLQLLPPAERALADVWNVAVYNNSVFFRTLHRIIRYNPATGQTAIYKAKDNSRWIYMAVVNGELYAQDETTLQLMQYQQQRWVPALLQPQRPVLALFTHTAGSLLLVTFKDGLWTMNNAGMQPFAVDPDIIKHQPYSACRVNEQTYALGTASNGIYFISSSGRTVRHLSTREGLQNNHVRTLFTDNEANLWAGLDEGIDMIHYNTPVHRIKPVPQPATAAYAMQLLHNRLYIGTAEGLYAAVLNGNPQTEDVSLCRSAFALIPHSQGQTWNLDTLNSQLLLTHNEGLFTIGENNATPVNKDGKGMWQLKRLPKPGKILAGTYEGLRLLQQQQGALAELPVYNNTLKESLRFLEIDYLHHIVWASHPYRGVYRLQLSAGYDTVQSVRLFTQKDGLPDKLENYVFTINNEIVFATTKGIYTFNNTAQTFEPAPQYASLFGRLPVSYMVNDAGGKIWFVSGDKTGVADKTGITWFPELQGQLVKSFEKIYPYNDRNIFIASYRGVIHLNFSNYEKNTVNLSARLTRVTAHDSKDSLLYSDYFMLNEQPVAAQPAAAIRSMTPGFRSFHFEYASNHLHEADKLLYSCRLVGLEDNWTAWSAQNNKDYFNLPHGSYRFEVRVQDNLGNISAVTAYAFRIQPRWYQTRLAGVMYVVMAVLLIAWLNRLHHKRLRLQTEKFKKEEARMKYLHDLEIKNNEREIIQLKNDRLETEVNYKNRELASATMHLHKRGQLLGRIKEELWEATKSLPGKESKAGFNKVLRLISEEERRDHDWKQFSIHFDQVHNQFLSKLKAAYPELSATDLKVCAYLKMNLSSKEIAELLSISLKGVEVARYRLRKKLNLQQGDNLVDFICRSL